MVSPPKLVELAFLLSLAFKHIGLETTLIAKILCNVLSFDAIGLVHVHIAMVVGPIRENIMPWSIRQAILELPHKNTAVMKVHSSVALWLTFLYKASSLHN